MELIIDVGNTRVKVAVFEKDTIIDLFIFNETKIIPSIKKILKSYKIEQSIISLVAKISNKKIEKLHGLLKLKELNYKTKVPFFNLYKTPEKLGVDRIALASFAVSKYPYKNTLIIDVGTCITFDFVNEKNEYLGGSISPGLKMRYQSLNNYTSELPLLEAKEFPDSIGTNTEECIHSGVVNGICNEVDGVINEYKKKYSGLTVVLTGGDTIFLAKQLKNHIFANPNLILEGLYKILIYNKAND